MRVEATITAPSGIQELVEHGRSLEEAGYDTILVPEAGHDPFLPIMALAEHTQRVTLGTGIAVAFPRSPFVTAQIAWDLQRFSGGRFQLGLGTQVRGHNERRYSTPWPSPPTPRLREYILCSRRSSTRSRPGRPRSSKGSTTGSRCAPRSSTRARTRTEAGSRSTYRRSTSATASSWVSCATACACTP